MRFRSPTVCAIHNTWGGHGGTKTGSSKDVTWYDQLWCCTKLRLPALTTQKDGRPPFSSQTKRGVTVTSFCLEELSPPRWRYTVSQYSVVNVWLQTVVCGIIAPVEMHGPQTTLAYESSDFMHFNITLSIPPSWRWLYAQFIHVNAPRVWYTHIVHRQIALAAVAFELSSVVWCSNSRY